MAPAMKLLLAGRGTNRNTDAGLRKEKSPGFVKKGPGFEAFLFYFLITRGLSEGP